MEKYRKKPIVIEAYQTDVPIDIETPEGIMHASVGDYIITGVNGEQYPCKPDIFKKTYEEISEPSVEPKKGKWIYGEDEYGMDGYKCDKCGFFVPWDYTHTFINYINDYHYCPNCGADMRGERDEQSDR